MAAQPATRKASDAFNDGASDATTEAAEGVGSQGWSFRAELVRSDFGFPFFLAENTWVTGVLTLTKWSYKFMNNW